VGSTPTEGTMRQRKELIKNRKFKKMARDAYRTDPEKKELDYKRWLLKYWDDLLLAWDTINDL
jgi:hypothetical protein